MTCSSIGSNRPSNFALLRSSGIHTGSCGIDSAYLARLSRPLLGVAVPGRRRGRTRQVARWADAICLARRTWPSLIQRPSSSLFLKEASFARRVSSLWAAVGGRWWCPRHKAGLPLGAPKGTMP